VSSRNGEPSSFAVSPRAWSAKMRAAEPSPCGSAAARWEALIQEIDRLDSTSDDWVEKMEELQEALEQHIEEEEGDIWPRIQQAWDQSQRAESSPRSSPRNRLTAA